MTTKKTNNIQLVTEITLLLALFPALIGYYANYKGRWIISLLCYLLSVFILSVPVVVFVAYKSIRTCAPFILRTLTKINQRLLPIAKYLTDSRILGPLISLFIRSQFFMWFIMLLMSDQLVRSILGRFAGQHASNRYLSLINVGDSRFFTKKSIHEELKQDNPHAKAYDNEYSLSVASKLAYEDVAVVKYELEQGGFHVEESFHAIGYKNVCAYIVEKDNNVMLVFRGTNPLNIQNYVTNIDAGLTRISSADKYMGRVHKGFWDAMGATASSDNLQRHGRFSDISIDLDSTSLYVSISSAVQAIARIMKALSSNIFANVTDPIDASWAGHQHAVRHQSMYTQAEVLITKLLSKDKKLYVTGHSLGGALATVFVAKMIQCESPILQSFGGLYTFGMPNIGDEDFGRSFSPVITCKIFNHTYNNDIVPRVPFWAVYSAPPGTLVFIDSSNTISMYPPHHKTQKPIPVRPISFLHLSGLLNKSVIYRLRSETPIRVLFRALLPFFLNDHFCSDYSDALLKANMGEQQAGFVDLQIADEEKRIL